jgi:hypothetical protein
MTKGIKTAIEKENPVVKTPGWNGKDNKKQSLVNHCSTMAERSMHLHTQNFIWMPFASNV